jgi:hypothetical protein
MTHAASADTVKAVPTLGVTHLTPSQATTAWEKQWVARRALTPELVQRAEDAVDEHRAWFRRALAAGVRMAPCWSWDSG